MPISPVDAERIVLEAMLPLAAEACPLAEAHGRILRAPIVADRDLPPFDRVTMDGYALRSAAWAAGTRQFRIIGTQAAGVEPLILGADDECVEIMTGAVLPIGADCVVPYEETSREGTLMTITSNVRLGPGHSVHARGSDCAKGTVIVPAGTRLTGREIAVAAACGEATLRVGERPAVAVVATGDELVAVDVSAPAPHQIRQSNGPALRAALLAGGRAVRVELFHLRDNRAGIEAALRQIVAEFDVVLLTGGVSKGKFDFVPAVLAALGVEKKIAGVAQRPGKPFWFGVTSRHTPVFALPGNPVSGLVCYRRYVVPALDKMLGSTPTQADWTPLATATTHHPTLTRMLPVRVTTATDGKRTAQIMPCNTSGDFAELVGTDGFVELPPCPLDIPTGTVVRHWAWDN